MKTNRPTPAAPLRSAARRFLLPAVLLGTALAVVRPATAQDGEIDFNRDIRAVLSDNCFKCHGFDAATREAGLRLDTWEGLTGDRDNGPAVVPGDADASDLIARIESDHAGLVMPPPDSQLELTDDEKHLLRRWIDEGASFEDHWAFLPPERPDVPPTTEADDWARGPIDRFVAARLADEGLTPSEQADRRTLIRRVMLDLIGLPPTPEEIEAFAADASPDAYEQLVDRLLASPHFGERFALVWLDAARYADTNGFHHDNLRTAWPYRDWVIDALNANQPYDQFVVEQLAGDLLPEPTTEQLIATAFGRMHNINDEGGALDAEYRVEAIADRIETIATAMMGLTFTCARCHDHKYDPITQADYYSLYAYFNSLDERGHYAHNLEQARAYPARLDVVPASIREDLDAAQQRLADATAALDAARPAIAAEQDAWEAQQRDTLGVRWAAPALTFASEHPGVSFEAQPDHSYLVRGDNPAKDTYTFTFETDDPSLRLLQLDALTDPTLNNRTGRASNNNAVVTYVAATATSLADPTQTKTATWAHAWATHEQPNGDFDIYNATRDDALGWAVHNHQADGPRTALFFAAEPFGFEGGATVTVTVKQHSQYAHHALGRPRVTIGSLADTAAGVLPVTVLPTVQRDWFTAGPYTADTFDAAFSTDFGPETVTGLAASITAGDRNLVHVPDLEEGTVIPQPNTANSAYYYLRNIFTPVARPLHLNLGSDDAIRVFLNGSLVHENKTTRGPAAADMEVLSVDLVPGENTLVIKIINQGGESSAYLHTSFGDDAPPHLAPLALIDADRRAAPIQHAYMDSLGRNASPTYAALADAVAAEQATVDELSMQTVPLVIMQERAEPVQQYILTRGAYDAVDETRPVNRQPPEFFNRPLPEGEPNNRLGFARWLTQPDHPLTARVQVNRVWQTLFGEGLMGTPEDWGQQAAWPSHPQLLDWLAVEFVESGWDNKALIRQIVTSATYRQSQRRNPDAAQIDPDNALLSSFPRRRLPAELLRDQALAVAGLLVDDIGGPSVRPYQPPGLWREVSIGGNSNTRDFVRDDGDGLYRRSLYTFWKRTSPNPQMMLFDAPTREFCLVERGTTNTPLQALVLWNDEQFLEASRVLAQRTLAGEGDDATRLSTLFQRCTGRPAGDRELPILQRTLEGFRSRYAAAPEDAQALLMLGEAPIPEGQDPAELAAWTMTANAVMNLDETLVRD